MGRRAFAFSILGFLQEEEAGVLRRVGSDQASTAVPACPSATRDARPALCLSVKDSAVSSPETVLVHSSKCVHIFISFFVFVDKRQNPAPLVPYSFCTEG